MVCVCACVFGALMAWAQGSRGLGQCDRGEDNVTEGMEAGCSVG